MPQIHHLGEISLIQFANVLAAPGDFAVIRNDKSAQGAQQAGFATAVCALDLHNLPGMKRKAQIGKQTMITATTSKIADFQHEEGPEI